MITSYVSIGGVIVPQNTLKLQRARDVADSTGAGRLNFVTLIECLCDGESGAETVVIDVEVERPQQLANPIQRIERIAVRFYPGDDSYPEVLALRKDFPVVPHLNVMPTELPRSLCLYATPWSEIALRWTAASFIERIRYWLAVTAIGRLHQDDQPLEPLLLGNSCKIICPADLFNGKNEGDFEVLTVYLANPKSHDVLIADRSKKRDPTTLRFAALAIIGKPQQHGIIKHAPRDLRQLHGFLQAAGIDLISVLRSHIAKWTDEGIRNCKFLLMVALPLSRDSVAQVEASNVWAFASIKTVLDVGIAVGAWQKSPDGKLGAVVFPDSTMDGRDIHLDIISPIFRQTRDTAAETNGVKPDDRRVVAVGAGALGSKIIDILARGGFGSWSLIDDDVLLPHNLARHILTEEALGFPKVWPIAHILDGLYESHPGTTWIRADILNPRTEKDRIVNELSTADIVFDFAASVPVSRYLAVDAKSPARRIATFMNPRATDLVLLAEGADRSVTLDSLEMQYYRHIVHNPQFKAHLSPPEGRLRFARSCRDVTATMPGDLVTLHSALAARGIRQAVATEAPTIRLWRVNEATLETSQSICAVATASRRQFLDWTLVIDSHIENRLQELRESKLPNETGGVLIGAYDLKRRIVYVVDTVPSPPDSKEWPTLYIRGSEGLSKDVQRIKDDSGAQLEYVGEWHSHPRQCSCAPSNDDLQVFAWLTENMDSAGLPALMAIIGDTGMSAWYLGKMERAGGGWAP